MNDQILSPSAIILYQNCPFSFYLRYIKHYKPIIEDDTALRLGKSVHSILENFYKYIDLNTNNPEEHLRECLRKSANDFWDRSIDAKKRLEMETSLMLWLGFEIQRFKKYKEQNLLDRFRPISTEESITDFSARIMSIIDKRCIGLNGATYCIDYKTDKSLPPQRNFKGNLNEIDLKYKTQSCMNALVLQSQGIKLDAFYFQFIRYPDKLLSVPLTPELFTEINILIKKVRETTEFPKNPKACFLCGLKLHCFGQNKSIHCLSNNVL